MTTINDYNNNNRDNNDGNVRKADSSRTMSVRQQIILECMITQRTTKQTLQILKENGFEITDRTLRREKEIIKEKNRTRLYQIAKIDFHQQHMERIDKLKKIESEMWNDCEACQEPYKKTKIKEAIANLQPIISSYIDATRYVLEKQYPSLEKEKKEYSDTF